MTFKPEYKALNKVGNEVIRFWKDAHGTSVLHGVYAIKETINAYFKLKGLNACCMVGTMPNSYNFALLICTVEPSYKMIDRVEYKPSSSFDHLIQALEIIGIKCH